MVVPLVYVTGMFYSRVSHSLNVVILVLSDLIGHLLGNSVNLEQADLQARCDMK